MDGQTLDTETRVCLFLDGGSTFLLLDSVIRQRSHVIMSYLVGFLWVVMQAKWQLVGWFQILHAAFGFWRGLRFRLLPFGYSYLSITTSLLFACVLGPIQTSAVLLSWPAAHPNSMYTFLAMVILCNTKLSLHLRWKLICVWRVTRVHVLQLKLHHKLVSLICQSYAFCKFATLGTSLREVIVQMIKDRRRCHSQPCNFVLQQMSLLFFWNWSSSPILFSSLFQIIVTESTSRLQPYIFTSQRKSKKNERGEKKRRTNQKLTI